METQRFSVLLKLIAHPERLAILLSLLNGDGSIHELAQTLNLPPSAVSNHLNKLRSEGVVDYIRYHRVLEYRLTSTEAATILRTLRKLQGQTAQPA